MSYNSIKREHALICVGDGWKDLINELYDKKPNNVEVIQVKEKYGGLRFYVGSAPDEYLDLIDKCEHKSTTICENCGQPGKTIDDHGWLRTICEDCRDRK
jgi:hypothetical protein